MKLLRQLFSLNEGEGSRKIQVLFLGVALLVFGDKLGFTPDQMDNARWVILTYLGGQSAVDALEAKAVADKG